MKTDTVSLDASQSAATGAAGSDTSHSRVTVPSAGPPWVFGVLLHFVDGGHAEQILHVGTREECERVSDLLPAVAYSGGRIVARAERVICQVPTEVA